jgi:hypothetical protein
VISNDEQLVIALRQLAGFKDMLEAMRLHLSESEPSLVPTVSESYQHRILELQEEICDYLLRQRGGERKLSQELTSAQV